MVSRRRRAVLTAAAVAIAGCSSTGDGGGSASTTRTGTETASSTGTGASETTAAETTETTAGEAAAEKVPLAEGSRYVGIDRDTLRRNIVSGGPGKDGIPSIDEPKFVDAATADETLGEASRVFGVVVDGEARAYPKQIVVYHEIVNDVIQGQPIAVTYCPLTGTALGFKRGETTFGVSGRLVNSNLVMYDRATDSWWPQMAGTCIRGELLGSFLREIPLTWTRWDRWKAAHPDTKVLSQETGYIRAYGQDPYGRSYYTEGPPLFQPIVSSDRFDPKTVVLGARGTTSAVAVLKETLETEGVVSIQLDGEPAVAVYDDPLATGYVYRNPENRLVEATSEGVTVDGTVYAPQALPLPSVHAYEAMWFAWYGFYPETAVYA